MLITSLGVLLTLAGQPAAEVAQPKPIDIVGKVREVGGGIGGTGRALLVLDNKKEYELHGINAGDLSELRRLAGARIKVLGVTGDPMIPRGAHIRVNRYDILDVGGGVVPRVGQIASLEINGRERLIFVDRAGSADFLPVGWNKKMKRHVGSKVWMVGTGSGAKFKPTRFSILRTPRTAKSKTPTNR